MCSARALLLALFTEGTVRDESHVVRKNQALSVASQVLLQEDVPAKEITIANSRLVYCQKKKNFFL